MSEHTPGPWWIEHEDDEGQPLENGATIESPEGPVAFNVIDCSAHLIAAAPSLLATIKRMREVFEQLSDGDWRILDASYVDELIESDGLRSCDLAIAKAEGGE